MELKVIRKWKKNEYTIGDLYVDGVWVSNTLEDAVRDLNRNGQFDNGERIEIPIAKNGDIKWFDDTKLLRKEI